MKKEKRLKFASEDINNIRYIASSLIPQGVYRTSDNACLKVLLHWKKNVYDLANVGGSLSRSR